MLVVLLGLFLLTSPAFAENPVNDNLPDPDGKPADMTETVNVFIIMGQSNTLEYGAVEKKEPILKIKEGMSEQDLAKAKEKHQKRLAKYEQDKDKTLPEQRMSTRSNFSAAAFLALI